MSINYFPEPPIYNSCETKFISKSSASESATESVSRAEAKEHLYIETGNTDFDNIIDTLIPQVRQYLEEITCLSLISRTVTAYFDYYSPFRIPFGPVTSFTSAEIKTSINNYETKTINSDFEIENGWFTSMFGTYRVRLIFVGGYTSLTIPAGLKRAMLNEIAKRFEHRGDGSERKAAEIFDTNDLVEPYKMLEWLV